jgi:pyridoxal/pyridoxine/pyridoxamine kinase
LGNLKVEFAQSHRQYIVVLTGIILKLKQSQKIIGIAKQVRFALHPRFHHLLEPDIQHIMQIYIGKNR